MYAFDNSTHLCTLALDEPNITCNIYFTLNLVSENIAHKIINCIFFKHLLLVLLLRS